MIRAFLLALSGVSALAVSAGAGEIVAASFDSPTLGREYRYSVYLPGGYHEGQGRYPVLYLLHGAVGSEKDWPGGGGIASLVDGLVTAGDIPPLLVVMPGHSGSWWIDGEREAASTVLRQELIPHVDRTLRTVAAREGRLVGGVSAGGYGAANLALSHPELFAGAATLSPAVYVPLPPRTSGARQTPQFQVNGAFEPATWRALSYTARLPGYKAQQRVVPFYIVSGDHDVLGIAAHAATLFESLRSIQPDAVELRIVDGGHDWGVWRRTLPDALRYLCSFLGDGS